MSSSGHTKLGTREFSERQKPLRIAAKTDTGPTSSNSATNGLDSAFDSGDIQINGHVFGARKLEHVFDDEL